MAKVWIVEGVCDQGCDNTVKVFSSQALAIANLVETYNKASSLYEPLDILGLLKGYSRHLQVKKPRNPKVNPDPHNYYYLSQRELDDEE